jgi:hypothetical protein
MKEPTKVKMGIAKTLDKLQALHGMVVAIFRSRSRHTIRARIASAWAVLSDRTACSASPPTGVIRAPKIGAPRSLLLPSEPGFASLQGSLSIVTGKEYQMSDIERLIAVESGNFTGNSDFIP